LFSVITSKKIYGVAETSLAIERSPQLDARTLMVFATTDDWRAWAFGALSRNGFDCIDVTSSSALRQAASTNQSCAIVCNGDDKKAVALVRLARYTIGLRLPIVATTASVDEKFQLSLIESGVDQIVHNTASQSELVARLTAMLRRYNA
jgi:DNA-binding response OmpR family regulator